MHPSDEHLLPWFVAAGAAGREHGAIRLHASVTFGSLGMDAYAFGANAPRLAATLASAGDAAPLDAVAAAAVVC
jgi:4,5-DOPA dioxygenase extradiol